MRGAFLEILTLRHNILSFSLSLYVCSTNKALLGDAVYGPIYYICYIYQKHDAVELIYNMFFTLILALIVFIRTFNIYRLMVS